MADTGNIFILFRNLYLYFVFYKTNVNFRHSRERNADNSITQMAQMDDENISQAVTQAGGCLTLHSKWKSQFDDSEASENETEMKGENLQSPEHKQGTESPGREQQQPAVSRQLELSRITENTSHGSGHGKEGEKSNKTSPVQLQMNKTRDNEVLNKNSLHIEVNLPLPATASFSMATDAPKPASSSWTMALRSPEASTNVSDTCWKVPSQPSTRSSKYTESCRCGNFLCSHISPGML